MTNGNWKMENPPISAEGALDTAAIAEGLAVDDPNTHS